MRKKLAVITATLATSAALVPAAGAAITPSTNNGHPNTNPTGQCPPGQNQGATPGALNKCP